MRKPLFRPWDLCVYGAILLLAAAIFAVFAAAPAGAVARVYRDGELIAEHPLDAPGLFEVAGSEGALALQVQDGAIRVVSSGCPDQTCVHTAAASRAGQSIVCLPNRVLIKVEGGAPESGKGVDAVAG